MSVLALVLQLAALCWEVICAYGFMTKDPEIFLVEGESMDLTQDQKTAVAAWIEEGAGLSEIQRRLGSEFSLTPTYMDVRFLVIDLGLDVKDKVVPVAAPAPENGAVAEEGPMAEPMPNAFQEELPAAALPGDDLLGSSVSVELDRVMKPGAIVSGTVTFSDGQSAAWTLDQMGRLGLDPSQEGYSPSPEDIQAFQEKLREVLEKRGF